MRMGHQSEYTNREWFASGKKIGKSDEQKRILEIIHEFIWDCGEAKKESPIILALQHNDDLGRLKAKIKGDEK